MLETFTMVCRTRQHRGPGLGGKTGALSMSETVARFELVKDRIAASARLAKRDPTQVDLVVVSKTFLPEYIRPVIEAGHRVFGENRVQEAQGKWPALKAEFPGLELHLI